MKTFTDEDIKALAKGGKISSKEYMTLLLTAKAAIEQVEEKTDPESAVLASIRDMLALIASKIEPAKDSLPLPAPQVTVNVPKRGAWSATVVERDKAGFIKRVTFQEVGA